MVHRIHNRNTGYNNNLTGTHISNHSVINATEGATALDMNADVETNKIVKTEEEKNENQETTKDDSLKNISMENANYLQQSEEIFDKNDEQPNFEVDSIELATPQLFSDEIETNLTDQEKDSKIFETPVNDKNF